MEGHKIIVVILVFVFCNRFNSKLRSDVQVTLPYHDILGTQCLNKLGFLGWWQSIKDMIMVSGICIVPSMFLLKSSQNDATETPVDPLNSPRLKGFYGFIKFLLNHFKSMKLEPTDNISCQYDQCYTETRQKLTGCRDG